jgi:hypothetical protein
MKWFVAKFPPKSMLKEDVLVKRKFEDGSEDVRIGYFKYAAGCKDSPYFVVPMYAGEFDYKPHKKWEVIGWHYLPK